MPFYYYFDPTYSLVLIGLILCVLASARVRSTYAKYARVRSRSGMTGKEAAERILRGAGIYDVRVEHVGGNLTDHYDPRSKVLRLSDATYQSASVAAVGVAAHECGHAIQHTKGYAPLRIRSAIVPIANFWVSHCVAFDSIWFTVQQSFVLYAIQIGIIAFSFAVLFQIVTLPVEFNASNRAVRISGREWDSIGGRALHDEKMY